MTAKELRIGNYVTHNDYSDGIFAVSEITRNDNGFIIDTSGGKNGFWGNHISLVNPIQITEEWLIELGFKIKNHDKLAKHCFEHDANGMNIILARWHDNFDVYTKYDPIGLRKGRNAYNYITNNRGIRYIHQLQNLYFALTGEELVIQ